jgi:hypothetical protein
MISTIRVGEPEARVRRRATWRRRLLLLGAVALSYGAFELGIVGPASAGTLTSVSWTVTNSQTGKTGVTYQYGMKTATTGTIASVTMTVPSGTSGTPGVGSVYGLGAGTASISGTTLKYTVTSPVSVSSGISLYISFTGLTNTSTAGSYTSTVTTQTSTPTTIDSGTSASVTFGSSSTSVSVSVGQTLTFTNNTPSFSLDVDPADSTQSQSVVLTVQTNAASGYTVSASDIGLSRTTAPSYTIPDVSSGPTVGVSTFPADGWGVSATISAPGGSGAALASGLATAGNFVGYPSSAAAFVTATQQTGATADTLTLTNEVSVNYAVPEGTYTDTITYVVTPNY